MNGDGDLIRAARERHGLTQKELARLIGASRNAVGNWETKSIVPRNKLGKLREVLGLDENLLPLSDSPSQNLATAPTDGLVSRLNILLAEATTIAAELSRRQIVGAHVKPQAPRHAHESPGAVYAEDQGHPGQAGSA